MPSGGTPPSIGRWDCAPISKCVDLGLAWTQVPAAGVKTLLAAVWGAQDAGARHPIILGAPGECGDKEAGSCTLKTRQGLRRPPAGSEEQRANPATSGRHGLYGRATRAIAE